MDELKLYTQNIDVRITNLENKKDNLNQTSEELETFVNSMKIVQKQRWYTKITLKINPDFQSTFIALINQELI